MISSHDDRSVGGSLHRVLTVLNNLAVRPVPDPFSPSLMLHALR